MAHLGISEQLLISWFIKRGFTPYRQYFGHLTSGTFVEQEMYIIGLFTTHGKNYPLWKKNHSALKGESQITLIAAILTHIEKRLRNRFCMTRSSLFENKSRSFQKHIARINMMCLMQNSTKILRAFFLTQVF